MGCTKSKSIEKKVSESLNRVIEKEKKLDQMIQHYQELIQKCEATSLQSTMKQNNSPSKDKATNSNHNAPHLQDASHEKYAIESNNQPVVIVASAAAVATSLHPRVTDDKQNILTAAATTGVAATNSTQAQAYQEMIDKRFDQLERTIERLNNDLFRSTTGAGAAIGTQSLSNMPKSSIRSAIIEVKEEGNGVVNLPTKLNFIPGEETAAANDKWAALIDGFDDQSDILPAIATKHAGKHNQLQQEIAVDQIMINLEIEKQDEDIPADEYDDHKSKPSGSKNNHMKDQVTQAPSTSVAAGEGEHKHSNNPAGMTQPHKMAEGQMILDQIDGQFDSRPKTSNAPLENIILNNPKLNQVHERVSKAILLKPQ